MRSWGLALVFFSAACGTTSAHPARDAGHDGPSPHDGSVSRDASPPGDAGGDTSSKDCTGPGLAKVWENMDHAEVTATSAANLDLTLGGGITLAQAQAVLCAGSELAPLRDGFHVQAWGESNEVELVFDPTTGYGQELSLYQGYFGTLELKSDPASGPQHTFTIGLGQVKEDGAPLEMVWTETPFTAGNAIFNALMYTYGRSMGLYSGPIPSCTAVSVCPYNTSTGKAEWNIVPLGMMFTFDSVASQPAASTVDEIDLTVP
jgi:hypothetical protein